MAAKRSEHQEQVALIAWFKLQFPKFRKHIFAIPNGAHLEGDSRVRAIKMNKLKSEGFLVGTPDLFMLIPKAGYHGMFIEMKSNGGTVTEDQAEFIGRASLMGYFCIVCYGFDEAKNAISEYLGGQL